MPTDNPTTSSLPPDNSNQSQSVDPEPRQQSYQPSEQIIKLEKSYKSGASWFFWIAGLSLVNTIMIFMGSDRTFVVGLGVTQVANAVAMQAPASTAAVPGASDSALVKVSTAEPEAPTESGSGYGIGLKVAALAVNVVAIGFFVLMGFLATRRYRWAFIVGLVLYCLDGLILLAFHDFMSAGFHAFAAFCVFAGWRSLAQLNRLTKTESAPLAAG
jgi:hypothetical protein